MPPRKGWRKFREESEAFAALDFHKKLADLQTEFDRLSVHSKGKMAAMLQDEAAALSAFAETGIVEVGGLKNAMLEALAAQMQLQGGATIGDKQDAALRALRDRIEAERTINDLVKEINGEMRSVSTLYGKEARAVLTTRDALREVEAELAKLYSQKMPDILNGENLKPEELQKALDGWKRIHALEGEHLELLKKNNEWVNQLGGNLAIAATEGITHFSKLGDVFSSLGDQIAKMMIQLALVNPIMNGLFGASGFNVTGWKPMATFASGGRPNTGEVSMVGENGPELFVPDSAGTIVPNHKLGGGITINQSYSIGSGVTAQQLMPILAMQKRDLLATLADAKRRGLGGAFA
jgi:hypothetical protein